MPRTRHYTLRQSRTEVLGGRAYQMYEGQYHTTALATDDEAIAWAQELIGRSLSPANANAEYWELEAVRKPYNRSVASWNCHGITDLRAAAVPA